MTKEELKAKIEELKELKNMKAELEDLISGIEDEIKAQMMIEQTDELVVDAFKVTWKSVTSSRFDSSMLKKVDIDTYNKYLRESTSRRFTVS